MSKLWKWLNRFYVKALVLTFSLLIILGCSTPKDATPTIKDNPIKIVENGTPKAIIVLSDEPTPMADYAAKEFVTHIEKATGVKLSVFPESKVFDNNKNKIFIGITKSTLEQNINPQSLGPDVFLLRSVGKDLYIVGNERMDADPLDDRNHSFSGTLFGVYELLERFLDIRWLWPGELGTYVPATKNLTINSIDVSIKPKLEFREFRWWEISSALKNYPEKTKALAFSDQGLQNYARDLKIFVRRHRINHESKPDVGHYFGGWWNEHGEAHPEWFSMRKDGTRGPITGENTDRVTMCVSNSELHDYIIENAWDKGDLLRLGEADNSRYCHCEKCMSWDGPQPVDAKDRIISDRYARFWKIIYDKAVKINPNVKVSTFLYVNYFPAPLTDIKLNKNIYGEFVPFSKFMIWYPATEEDLEWQREQWLKWRQTGISLGYRPNHPKAGYALPHINTWQGGEFVRFAYKQGMIGIDFDALSGQWAIKGIEHYMYFRLLVNPVQSIAEIRSEYFEAFGPAAESVESYFDYWENYNIKLKREGRWSDIRFNPENAPSQYPNFVFPPAEAILDQALVEAQKSPNKDFVKRIEFLKNGLEHGKLSVNFVRLLNKNSPNAKSALKELTDFRRAHEDSYISNYVYLAVRCERRFLGDKIDNL